MQSNCSRILPILRGLATKSGNIRHNFIPQQQRTFFSRRSNALWDVSHTFRQVERQFEQMERDMMSVFRNVGFTGSRYLPSVSLEWSTPMTMYETESDNKYVMNVVIGKNLPPENIKVTLKDRTVTVDVKYEQSYDYEDGKSKLSQELVRTFTLPDGIDTTQIKSLLTPDGILQFEAPLPPKVIEDTKKNTEIPINFEEKASLKQ